MIHLLAYRPFVDCLDMAFPSLSNYWLALIFPLLIAICLVYKGTKVDHLRHLPKEAARLFVQIVVVMTLAALTISVVYWALAKWA